jgi:hypothetical protein
VQQELLAAGIFDEEQLQAAQGGVALTAGVQDALGGGAGMGAMQRALRADEQRRMRMVQVAEGWLLAQDVLMGADEEGDMP